MKSKRMKAIAFFLICILSLNIVPLLSGMANYYCDPITNFIAVDAKMNTSVARSDGSAYGRGGTIACQMGGAVEPIQKTVFNPVKIPSDLIILKLFQ